MKNMFVNDCIVILRPCVLETQMKYGPQQHMFTPLYGIAFKIAIFSSEMIITLHPSICLHILPISIYGNLLMLHAAIYPTLIFSQQSTLTSTHL